MPNLYARPSHVMAAIAGTSYDPADGTLLPQYVRAIERVSREVDRWTNRRFYAEVATRYFDVPAACRELALPMNKDGDLISVTTLKVDDDYDWSYGLTLTEGTDFVLMPYNTTPKWRIAVHPNSTNINNWPAGPRRVQIVGTFGYSYDLESTGLTGTVASSSTTTLTANAAATSLIDVGETLVLDSEQVYVTAVSAVTVSITRAQNGTTAASHTAGTTIYRRLYPADVTGAVIDQVGRQRWNSQSGYAGAVLIADDENVNNRMGVGLWPRIKDTLNHYRLPGVG